MNIRLISATNRDLGGMIADGTFREDLFYRIGVFPLKLPPLRDRREDLPALARMFLKRYAAAEGAPVEGFARPAIEAIERASWPGNVRQLENTIHRAVVMADGSLIGPGDLLGLDGPLGSAAAAAVAGGGRGRDAAPPAGVRGAARPMPAATTSSCARTGMSGACSTSRPRRSAGRWRSIAAG